MEVTSTIVDVFDKLLARPIASARQSDASPRFFVILAQLLETNLSERVAVQVLATVKAFIHKVRARGGRRATAAGKPALTCPGAL